MKQSNNAPFTPELETPIGFMSPTKIDQKCGEIMSRMLAETATDEDKALHEQLMDIRRRGIFTPPGETPPRRRRKPL